MSSDSAEITIEDHLALTQSAAEICAAESQSAVYEILLESIDSCLEIVGGKVFEWTSESSEPQLVWKSSISNPKAKSVELPEHLPSDIRSIDAVQVIEPDAAFLHRAGGSSLIAVPINLPLTDSFQIILICAIAPSVDTTRPAVWMLDNLKSVAALSLANFLNSTQKEQDRQALNEAVESVPLGVLAVAKDRRILICNRNTEFIFSLRRIEILGKDYSTVLPTVLIEAMEDLIRSISRWEDTFDREFSYSLDPRTTLRIGISVVPMTNNKDQVFGYVFILRDMTLTREAQTLRELNLLNLEFIQTVSHEIKAPLTAVLMGTDYLLARGTNFDSEQRETLQTVDQGAQRLQELVVDLLDLVTFESGHISLDFEMGDLGALVEKVIRTYRKLPNVELSLETNAPMKPFRFDQRKVRRVLENLVSNAVKYSPDRAVVKISITRMEDLVQVSVSDQGIGIPPEHIPYVWDKFYRIQSSAIEKASGTGLGLALAKQIVTMHHGKVSVQSNAGKGSTFSFTLPMSTAL